MSHRNWRINGSLARLATSAGIMLFLVVFPSAAEAVTVTPTALYITHETRSATLTLRNPGDRPVEVTIGFAFGFPKNDSSGGVHVPLHDIAPEGEPSAAGWLRAFPRQIRLEPGERQVIRVLATPPANLAEGEYWARVLVTSRGGQPPIEQSVDGRTARLEMETVLVLPAAYRNGSVRTGVAVREASAEATPEGVRVELDLVREGDAAYLGRVVAEIVAPGGQIVARGEQNVAVYRELVRHVMIPWPDDYAGGDGYQVRYRLSTDRPDLPPAGPLRAPPVEGRVAVAPAEAVE
jgi:fimbrial chaperone protein